MYYYWYYMIILQLTDSFRDIIYYIFYGLVVLEFMLHLWPDVKAARLQTHSHIEEETTPLLQHPTQAANDLVNIDDPVSIF